ncbi:antagonist of KipI [Marivirga sericea]|uniref:Antagonist of KipI n=1 Tax=Marivirga sericea TaxID=1028 RepID=A0A1X7IIZ0_9BACT|nr:biotin-dependent carboxyltransferase family protein [Marivirga sericea]SMG14859.1 antagonist of KipI [Marivirga sericea]
MSNDLTLTFLKAGLQTTLQDNGRKGYQQLGIPKGGALDQSSASMANHIVGNESDEPLLEITMAGPEILFDSDAIIAVTGAHFDVYSDNVLIENDKVHYLESGTMIRFDKLNAGCRAYLAVAGNWKVKKWKDSVSPLLQVAEATPNSVIKKGTKININSSYLNHTNLWDKKIPYPALSNKVRLRVLVGPEFHSISRLAIANFFGKGHKVSNDANRMGYRLSSQLEKATEIKELISSGIIPGTVQLTGSGQPIILLNDAQTTGGYPRIANIIDEDLDQLAQLKPGDEIWFSLI